MGSRRIRAAAFAAAAAICAIGSASLASGYRTDVDAQLGELSSVVVSIRSLEGGKPLSRRQLRSSLELREMPERFVPVDALRSTKEALGRRPAAAIPVGSYLVASQFKASATARDRGPALPDRLRAVDLTVSGGSALEQLGAGSGARVDVIVAGEPNAGGEATVRVAAKRVRLISLERRTDELASTEGETAASEGWIATVAVAPEQVLRLIEAENYAREVRVIPR